MRASGRHGDAHGPTAVLGQPEADIELLRQILQVSILAKEGAEATQGLDIRPVDAVAEAIDTIDGLLAGLQETQLLRPQVPPAKSRARGR